MRQATKARHCLVATAFAQGKTEVSSANQWCAVPHALVSPHQQSGSGTAKISGGGVAPHAYDPYRSQEEIINGISSNNDDLMMIKGVAREWLSELNELRSLPSTTLSQRLVNKQMRDFERAATDAALAVSEGEVLPYSVTPSDTSELQMYRFVVVWWWGIIKSSLYLSLSDSLSL